ncbi:hypothetical protein CLOM_g13615 [Closterium sp. NIES-68]|nr:hypothetical protein CLOM_g13615 [Closterium sp. NIES-68]GJP77102.1 hypothetical protein CLOP_g7544 [Closterium sp. NIES-67]
MAPPASTSLLSRARQALAKYVRPPWNYTGPTASAEFRESVPVLGEYRPFAPTNPPAKASIPQSDLDRVFNIKYHDRERRRAVFETKKETLTVAQLTEQIRGGGASAEASGEAVGEAAGTGGSASGASAEYSPPTPGKWYFYGQERHLNDCPGDGYQK